MQVPFSAFLRIIRKDLKDKNINTIIKCKSNEDKCETNTGFNLDWWAFASLPVFARQWFSGIHWWFANVKWLGVSPAN